MTTAARQQVIDDNSLDALTVRTLGGLTTVAVSRGGVRGEAQSYDGEAATIAKAIENLTEASVPKGEEKAEGKAAEVGETKATDGTEGQASGEKSEAPVAPEGSPTNAKGTEVKAAGTADQGAPAPGSDAATGSATSAASTPATGGGRSGGR